jgi:hypothetical protein
MPATKLWLPAPEVPVAPAVEIVVLILVTSLQVRGVSMLALKVATV